MTHIEDHRAWMESYELTEAEQQQLDAFYDAWQESGTLPNISDYLDIDSILF